MFMTFIASSVSKILRRQSPFHHLLFTMEWEFWQSFENCKSSLTHWEILIFQLVVLFPNYLGFFPKVPLVVQLPNCLCFSKAPFHQTTGWQLINILRFIIVANPYSMARAKSIFFEGHKQLFQRLKLQRRKSKIHVLVIKEELVFLGKRSTWLLHVFLKKSF